MVLIMPEPVIINTIQFDGAEVQFTCEYWSRTVYSNPIPEVKNLQISVIKDDTDANQSTTEPKFVIVQVYSDLYDNIKEMIFSEVSSEQPFKQSSEYTTSNTREGFYSLGHHPEDREFWVIPDFSVEDIMNVLKGVYENEYASLLKGICKRDDDDYNKLTISKLFNDDTTNYELIDQITSDTPWVIDDKIRYKFNHAIKNLYLTDESVLANKLVEDIRNLIYKAIEKQLLEKVADYNFQIDKFLNYTTEDEKMTILNSVLLQLYPDNRNCDQSEDRNLRDNELKVYIGGLLESVKEKLENQEPLNNLSKDMIEKALKASQEDFNELEKNITGFNDILNKSELTVPDLSEARKLLRDELKKNRKIMPRTVFLELREIKELLENSDGYKFCEDQEKIIEQETANKINEIILALYNITKQNGQQLVIIERNRITKPNEEEEKQDLLERVAEFLKTDVEKMIQEFFKKGNQR
jgi:hypothetical protein